MFTILALALALVAAPAGRVRAAMAALPPTWTHDPASPVGPAHWGALSPAWTACVSAEGQLPVAITATTKAQLPTLRVHYSSTPLIVENTGHVVEALEPVDGGGTLVIGDHSYQLLQWHVHAPSEHVINGYHADLEIHLVNQDAQGNIAVLAVFANVVVSHGAALETPAARLLPHGPGGCPGHRGRGDRRRPECQRRHPDCLPQVR